MNLLSNRKSNYQKVGAICLTAFAAISVSVLSLTEPHGQFSFARFGASILCCVLGLIGTIFSVRSMRNSIGAASRVFSVSLATLNCAGTVLSAIFVVGGLLFLQLEHRYEKEAAAAQTNAIHLAFEEFRSNRLFYTAQYTNAAYAMAQFSDLPVSSLKSKECLASRGIILSNFVATGMTYQEFIIRAPKTFTREVEDSGESPESVTNTLRTFKQRELHLWDEQYSVVEKTILMTSNTWVLNCLLESNYDRWGVSNGAIVFREANLAKEYSETVAKVKQLKSELQNASKRLDNMQRRRSQK